MSVVAIAIGFGVFVAAAAGFAAVTLMPGPQQSATEDRLAMMANRRRGRGEPDDEASSQSLMLLGAEVDKLPFADLLDSVPGFKDFMEQAGLKIHPAKVLFVCLVLFGLGFIACVATPVPVALGPVLGGMLAVLPIGYIFMKRRKRLKKFGNQMPEALELLSRSLRAGHSLNAGFGLVGSEMEDPLGPEFQRAFEEQNLGIPLDEAIEEMANRIPNMDVRFFATAVALQRQTGGDLAEILDKIGRLVRERLTIQGQIQALTGEGRMSGAVLLGMPPALFLMMLKMNFEYISLLFTDPLGHLFMGIGIFTQALGAIVIKKIITIKV
ncbi:MAG: type II secretion system F family protein [Planctomycetota bacterium]